jgi:hypothetical protein
VVDFSVFNELSLPLNVQTAQAKAKFGLFFELLKKLSDKGLNQIIILALSSIDFF